jgi:hypothetical protein
MLSIPFVLVQKSTHKLKLPFEYVFVEDRQILVGNNYSPDISNSYQFKKIFRCMVGSTTD